MASNMLAAASLQWPVCYNHLEKRADFKCFDCKYESVIHLCPQCNIQVHSLDVFRAHRVEPLELKGRERRLSQDVSDIEKLIEVERELLQSVLTKLKYTEQEEQETLSHLIHLQNASKKRMVELKDCEAKVEKAFGYLAKVSTMITQCSSPVEGLSDNETLKDPAIESAVEQPSAPAQGSSDQPCERPPQEPVGGDEKVPTKEPLIKLSLPEEMKDKEVFPVCVTGSLTRSGSFWIAKIGEAEEEKQRQIQATIKNHYFKIGGFGNPVVAKEGVFCAAYHRKTKELCRTRVELVTNSGMIRLRYLDLGTVDEVSQSSLCELSIDVVDAPFQALECCLLPDPDTQLPYEAKWCFKDLTFNKLLVASVVGQVTDKKGVVLHHVLLGSCGDNPVLINREVAKLVEAQKQALEDRPLQPKAEKTETVEVASREEGDSSKSQAVETATPGNPAQEVDTKVSAPEEEEASAKTVTEISVTADEVVVGYDKIEVSAEESDHASEDKPALRAEAAEFVPVSPESESLLKEIPPHTTFEQKNVPGILHLPVQDTPVNPVLAPAIEQFNNALPDTKLPVGCVDFATYSHILTKCSLNMICEDDLAMARFVMIRSDIRRIVEAMKFNVWCSNSYGNRRLNRVFNDAANKDRGAVFLLFAGMKSSLFCGMAEMLSAVDPKKSCPMLNEPFKFGSKMMGRCEIKWIYSNNVHFGDVITPTCGFARRYLEEANDGYEIANKLGQVIVKVFDSSSSGNFQSILQQALKSHQSYLHDPQENGESFDAEPSWGNPEPLWSTPEPSEGLPASQEDWDKEIVESLKAREVYESSVQEGPQDNAPREKQETDFSVVPEVDEHVSTEETSSNIPPEKEETNLSAVSEVDTHVSVEGRSSPAAATSSVISDAQVQKVNSSKDIVPSGGDSEKDVEEAISKVVDAHHQDETIVVSELQPGFEHEEKVQGADQGILPVSSKEGEGPVESSVPSSQEVKAEGSALESEACKESLHNMDNERSATNEGQPRGQISQEMEADWSVPKQRHDSVPSLKEMETEGSALKKSQASAPSSHKIEAEGSVAKERLASVPSSRELEAEWSAPKEGKEDQDSMYAGSESDWESGLADSVSISDVYATQFVGTVSKSAKDDNSSKDAQNTFSGRSNSPCGSTVDVQKEASVDVTQVSAVEHECRDSSDEAVHVASKSQQELSETININQDDKKLEPHTCNSSGVEAIEDNHGGDGGEALLDPCAGDKVCDGSEIVATDTGGPSTLEDKGQVNGEAGVKHDPVSVDLLAQEVLSHESSELSDDDDDDLPVEIGKEHWIEPQESVSSSGTFWARVVRTSKEETGFVNAMKRMGAHIVAKQKLLDPGGIHIYKQCAVKGWDGYWYRALVEKILDKGKIDIRLLDLGELWQVHQKELRVLDDEFYASPPAQAFECTLCYENPNSKKEKSRTSKLVKKKKKIRVVVKSYSRDGTVGVQVLS
ncbi:uncharacterized protein LOC144629867 [Oculina patagonica]